MSSNGQSSSSTTTTTNSESTLTSSSTTTTGGNMITEDEAALYDRQLRLWGVEAQNKMRSSSILIINFGSISAEISKNIVLAGIGSLTLLDHRDVEEFDLGGNFFLSQDSIGQKRVDAGLSRLQALNPRVQLKTRTDLSLLSNETFLSQFDLIVLTDVDANTLEQMNQLTRKLNKKLYAASSIGIDGWIFADLLSHEFIVDIIKTTSPGESIKTPTKKTLEYTSFENVLKHSWKSNRPKELRKTQSNLWGILALFEYQRRNKDQSVVSEEGLKSIAKDFLPTLGVNSDLLPDSIISQIARTCTFEFPPTAAILGGIAGQDVLNVIGGKEEPIRNLMVFDGTSGQGNVWFLGGEEKNMK